MNGLKTSRVLVVDDKPEEVGDILKALGQLGVGTVFCTGQPDELPREPLAGIRLLFLDMDLGTGATEAKQIVGQTIHVLKEILSAGANPVMIVIWTNKKDLVEDFQEAMQRELPHLRPGIVHTMAKAEFANDLAAIRKRVADVLRANTPLDLICLWEQCVHDAATETTGTLSGLIADEDKKPQVWSEQMHAMLASLVRASAGSMVGPPSSVLWALCESLTLVHFDRLGMIQERRGRDLEPHAKPLEAALKLEVQTHQRAALNRMLLIEDVAKEDTRVRPGNVYVRPDGAKNGEFLADRAGIDANLLAEDLGRGKPKESVDRLRSGSKVLVAELTPPCDFAQGKQHLARFLAGMLVPADMRKLVSSPGQFLWVSDPVSFPDTAAPSHIVLDARLLFGMPKADVKVAPDFRLRNQALVAIQAWFASHAARPGLVSVR